jgi:tripartite-type tricarboxylate transporter receptor subunit TctC
LVSPKSPLKTYAELVAAAKKPGGLNYGSGGPGSIGHIVGELFQTETGMDLVHVPYRGSAPMTQDLMAGLIPVGIDVLSGYLGHLQANSLQVLAVTSRTRSPLAPQAPSVVELGMPGLVSENYFGVSAPAGLPPLVAEKLRKALTEVVATPEITKKLEDMGISKAPANLDFSAYVEKQAKDWAPAVRKSGAKL